jgi:hypothetical protein
MRGLNTPADVSPHYLTRHMKHKITSQIPNQNAVNPAPSMTVAKSNQTATTNKPSSDTVAQKAYFTYLNEGSLPGREVKHWLEAEAQLFAGIDREMKIFPR